MRKSDKGKKSLQIQDCKTVEGGLTNLLWTARPDMVTLMEIDYSCAATGPGKESQSRNKRGNNPVNKIKASMGTVTLMLKFVQQ